MYSHAEKRMLLLGVVLADSWIPNGVIHEYFGLTMPDNALVKCINNILETQYVNVEEAFEDITDEI